VKRAAEKRSGRGRARRGGQAAGAQAARAGCRCRCCRSQAARLPAEGQAGARVPGPAAAAAPQQLVWVRIVCHAGEARSSAQAGGDIALMDGTHDGWDAQPSKPWSKSFSGVNPGYSCWLPVNVLGKPWKLVTLPVNHLEGKSIWSPVVLNQIAAETCIGFYYLWSTCSCTQQTIWCRRGRAPPLGRVNGRIRWSCVHACTFVAGCCIRQAA
jgi:hypothetical protein